MPEGNLSRGEVKETALDASNLPLVLAAILAVAHKQTRPRSPRVVTVGDKILPRTPQLWIKRGQLRGVYRDDGNDKQNLRVIEK